MTEHEYVVEMLCCLPKEVLLNYAEGKTVGIPSWLIGIKKEEVLEALERYDEPAFRMNRSEQQKYL